MNDSYKMERITMKIFIGIPVGHPKVDVFESAATEIAERLTRTTGGLSWNYCKGTWLESAASFDSVGPYEGEIEHQMTAWFSIIYTEDMEEDVYASVQENIREVVAKYELPAKYIHVEKCASIGLHFVI